MVAVSYATPAPDYTRLKGLTYETATAEDRAHTQASWDWRDLAGSVFVVGMIRGDGPICDFRG